MHQKNYTDRCDEPNTITSKGALKLSGLAETGGQATLTIQSRAASVNGEVKTRRKLREGDVIAVGDEEVVLLDEKAPEALD